MRRSLLAALIAAIPLPAFAACPTLTTIVDVGSVSLQQNTLVTVPPTGGASANGQANIEIRFGLDTATKESSGKSVFVEIDVSPDGTDTTGSWSQLASIQWQSYGSQHIAHLPGGCIIIDPDPTIDFPMMPSPAIYRLKYNTPNLTTAHPVVYGH